MNKAEELCHSSGPWKKHKYFKKIGEGAKAIYRYKVTGEGYKENAKAWDKAAKSERERAEMLREYYGEEWDKFSREKQMELILKSYNPHEGEAKQGYNDQLNLMAKKDAFDKNPTFGAKSTAADYYRAGQRKDRHKRESEEREKNYQKLVKDQEDRTFWAEQGKESMRGAIKGAIKNSTEFQKNAAQERENYRTKSLKGIAETQISKGQEKINKLFKSETKVTIKDTFTGETRTPSKPKSKSDTINIKQASEKNKKKKKKSNTSTNVNTFTLGPDGTTQAPANGKWRKVY